jgi:hypothetical protein
MSNFFDRVGEFQKQHRQQKATFFYNRMLEFYCRKNMGARNGVVEPARQTWNRFLGSFKGLQIRAQIPQSKAGAGSASKSKFRGCGGLKWSHGETWTLPMEAWRLKIET